MARSLRHHTAAHAMWDRDTASRGLGMELLDAGNGAAAVRMTVTGAMVNGHGIAHGGYVFLLADTAFACACNSHGPVTVAAGADIAFLQPVREGDVLVAAAAERARSGRSGIYDVTVTRDGDVVAEFRGRSRTIGDRDDPGRDDPGHSGPGHSGPGHDDPGHSGPGRGA